jgi:hypothetical protein
MSNTICGRVNAVVAAKGVGYYTYYAVMDDNSRIKLRRSCRPFPYPRAYLYNKEVCSGNKSELSRYWTFGQAPSSYVKEYLIRHFDVFHLREES